MTLFIVGAIIFLALISYIMFYYIPDLRDQKEHTLTMREYSKLSERNKLSSYIPYDLYDDEQNIYHHKNGDFAIIVRVIPRQTAGAMAASAIKEIFNKMEKGMIFQACLVGSRNDGGIISKWRDSHLKRVQDEKLDENLKILIKRAITSMSEFYYRKFSEPIAKQITTKSKDFSLYMSIVSHKYQDVLEFRNTLKNILDGNQFDSKWVEPKELQMLGYEIFNSNHSIKENQKPNYDPLRSISEQILAYDTEVFFTDEYVQSDNKFWINLSPLRYPEYAHVSDFGNKIGDYLSQSLNTNQFQDNFIISFTAQKQGDAKLGKIKKNHGLILTQKWPEDLFRKFNDVKKESISILDRIDVKKENCFSIDLNVLVSGEDLKKAEHNASVIVSYWNKGGKSDIVLTKTKGIQQLCFLASLPSCTNWEYYNVTSKYFSMFGDSAAQFVPLESDWKGNGVANLMLYSRRGQLAGFDMFVSNNNFNGYVIAESGSGKSVFLQMLAFNSFARGDRVFILDLGGSYKRLCEILGGQYIEPNRLEPISFNPFSEIRDIDHLRKELEFLSMFVYTLGANKHKDEYEKNQKFIKAYLQEIIERGYREFGNKLEITDIKEMLFIDGKKEQKIMEFCKQLSMYCRAGLYEEFFSGKCLLNFSNEFIVAELQQIEKDQDLRDPIIMLLTYHQDNAIYGSKNVGQQKILNIYDEAHKYIGKDPRMDDFIEQNYRRGRKQGASSIIATQGFEDIYDSASGKLSNAGKAIINSSSWKFFLKQSETSINLLIKSQVFNFDSFSEHLLRTTKTVKGDYSEIFMITPEESKCVYRLVMDRYFYYITTTDTKDKMRIQEKINQGMLFGEAIDEILKEENFNEGEK